jgi:hypothetical protein
VTNDAHDSTRHRSWRISWQSQLSGREVSSIFGNLADARVFARMLFRKYGPAIRAHIGVQR